MGDPMIVMGESLLALVFIIAILLVLAGSPLYPLAFGIVGIAALKLLLDHPDVFPTQFLKAAVGRLR